MNPELINAIHGLPIRVLQILHIDTMFNAHASPQAEDIVFSNLDAIMDEMGIHVSEWSHVETLDDVSELMRNKPGFLVQVSTPYNPNTLGSVWAQCCVSWHYGETLEQAYLDAGEFVKAWVKQQGGA